MKDFIVSYNVDSNIWLDFPEINKEALKEATPEGFKAFVSVSVGM